MAIKPGTPPYETLPYMPQLDALRAFAVGGVMLRHFFIGDRHRSLWAIGDWGQWGVQVFFVLSGFLITGILLTCRARIESGQLGFRPVLWKFYGRRFLRLMPIYYLTLAVIVTLAAVWGFAPALLRTFGWYLAYLQNFLFAWTGAGDTPHWSLNPFWTLAIEEQFYLLWAPMVLLLPRRWIVPILVTLILLVPVFKFVLVAPPVSMSWVNVRLLTPSHFDTLGLGSLLAVLRYDRDRGEEKAQRFAGWLLWPGLVLLACFVAGRAINYFSHPDYPAKTGVLFLFGSTALGMVFVWVIYRASRGFGGVAGMVLTWAPLIYLGKISYGLYVYHRPVQFLIEDPDYGLLAALGWPVPESAYLRLLLFSAATIAVASASWHLIERPLQRLKKYLRYGIPTDASRDTATKETAQA